MIGVSCVVMLLASSPAASGPATSRPVVALTSVLSAATPASAIAPQDGSGGGRRGHPRGGGGGGAPVPEPTSAGLVILSAAGLALVASRRRLERPMR